MPKRDPDSTLPLSMHDILFQEREKLAKLNDKIANLQDDDWIRDEIVKTQDKRNEQEAVVAVPQEAAYNLGLVDEFGNKIDPRNGQLEILFRRHLDGEQLEFPADSRDGDIDEDDVEGESGAEEAEQPAASDESALAVDVQAEPEAGGLEVPRPERRPSRPRRVREAEVA